MMTNSTARLKLRNHSSSVERLIGLVMDSNEEILRISVDPDTEIREARRAFSCLIQPEIGDLVCLIQDEFGHLYVTDILQRTASAGGDSIQASMLMPGRLKVEAPNGLVFKTGESIGIEAEKLEGKVFEVNWFSSLLRVTGKKLFVNLDVSRLTARLTEVLAQRMHLSAERSYRNISEAEHVRAGVIDMKAEQLASIKAECAVVTGKKLVKVDASQVHIG